MSKLALISTYRQHVSRWNSKLKAKTRLSCTFNWSLMMENYISVHTNNFLSWPSILESYRHSLFFYVVSILRRSLVIQWIFLESHSVIFVLDNFESLFIARRKESQCSVQSFTTLANRNQAKLNTKISLFEGQKLFSSVVLTSTFTENRSTTEFSQSLKQSWQTCK